VVGVPGIIFGTWIYAGIYPNLTGILKLGEFGQVTLPELLHVDPKVVIAVAAATALVVRHLLFSKLALRSKRFGHLIKGVEIQLIVNGKILPDAMKKADMTEHDLKEALRSNGGIEDASKVKAAYLVRSGKLSVLKGD